MKVKKKKNERSGFFIPNSMYKQNPQPIYHLVFYTEIKYEGQPSHPIEKNNEQIRKKKNPQKRGLNGILYFSFHLFFSAVLTSHNTIYIYTVCAYLQSSFLCVQTTTDDNDELQAYSLKFRHNTLLVRNANGNIKCREYFFFCIAR